MVNATAYLPAIICIVGLIVYLVAEGKISDAGNWAYKAGLIAVLWQLVAR